MITKAQAMTIRGTLVMFSYKNKLINVRVSGKCQTWVRDAERFRLPVKHGLYEHGEITDGNNDRFYLTMDDALLDHPMGAK